MHNAPFSPSNIMAHTLRDFFLRRGVAVTALDTLVIAPSTAMVFALREYIHNPVHQRTPIGQWIAMNNITETGYNYEQLLTIATATYSNAPNGTAEQDIAQFAQRICADINIPYYIRTATGQHMRAMPLQLNTP